MMVLRWIVGLLHSSTPSLSRALWLALVISASALPLFSQKSPPAPPSSPPPPPPPPVFVNSKAPDYGPAPVHTPTFQEQQYLRYLESRLNSMISDADKLLKLAKELNKETDSSKAGSSSPKDVQTVAEIEKLAHSVKWKMRLVADASQAH
jgi:hypothetical protein